MNETHGLLLQKLGEILAKLNEQTSNQVNVQEEGSLRDVNKADTEVQPDDHYEYPYLSQRPGYNHFTIQQGASLKPQRKPNKGRGMH